MPDDCIDFKERLINLETEVNTNLFPRIDKIELIIDKLTNDVSEIRIRFPDLATKKDLTEAEGRLTGKIDSAIIGLLKDSIAATPPRLSAYWAKWTTIWTAVGCLGALTSAVFGTLLFLKR